MHTLSNKPEQRTFLRKYARLSGLLALLAGAKMGKTVLADALVSESARAWMGRSYVPVNSLDVTSAAAVTFLSPQAMEAALNAGILSKSYIDDWAAQALVTLRLDSVSAVNTVVAFEQQFDYSNLLSRAGLIQTQGQKTSCSAYMNGDSNFIYLSLSALPTSLTTDVMLQVSKDGETVIKNTPSRLRRASLEEIESSGLSSIQGRKRKEDVFTSAPAAVLTSALYDNTSVGQDDELEDWVFNDDQPLNSYVIAFSEYSVILTDLAEHELNIVNKGDIAYIDDVKFLKHLSRASKSKDGSAPRKDGVSSLEELLKGNKFAAYKLFVSCDLVNAALAGNTLIIEPFSLHLQELARNLSLSSAPILIETEDKATSNYGAYARISAVEERRLAIRLKCGETAITFNVAESLTRATAGAILINPVIHLSVLNTTIVYDLAIKTTTRKGGLDSSQLDIMQYLSGLANRAGATIYAETRDDFFLDAGEAAVENARNTLGANSRGAMHITASRVGAGRDIWIRIKGGEKVADEEFTLSGITMEVYPTSFIRSSKPLPSFLDTVDLPEDNAVWIEASLSDLLRE